MNLIQIINIIINRRKTKRRNNRNNFNKFIDFEKIDNNDNVNDKSNKNWTAEQIDFFDSNMKNIESIVNIKKHVFYKNIYAFFDKINNIFSIKNKPNLRFVLPQCFRDSVLI